MRVNLRGAIISTVVYMITAVYCKQFLGEVPYIWLAVGVGVLCSIGFYKKKE